MSTFLLNSSYQKIGSSQGNDAVLGAADSLAHYRDRTADASLLQIAKEPVTLGHIIKLNGGRAPGFNTIRVILALGVILDHSFELTGSLYEVRAWYFVWMRNFLIPAFFALSGFLVAGSMMRLRSVPKFITFRGLRIFPALFLDTLLSALVLGPMVTTLPLTEYFRDSSFHSYFLNILGDIHYNLPGVFSDPARNISDTVNAQLWTIPSELYCYASLAVLMLCGLSYRPPVMIVVTALGMFGLPLAAIATGHLFPGPAHWSTIVVCFYAGAVLFLYRNRVPIDGRLLLLAFAGWLVSMFVEPFGAILGPFSAAYLICCAGMLRLPNNPLVIPGDFSYGLFLYGVPVQQFVIWMLHGDCGGLLTFALSVPVVAAVAIASWHLVEKRALDLRHIWQPAQNR